MVNEDALKKIESYSQEYKKNWGTDVDFTAIPSVISDEELADVLERIKETGESIICGYEIIFKNQQRSKPNDYHQ